jgi:hypothetical protein
MYHISQAKGLPKESLHHRNPKEPLHQWKSTQAYEKHKLSLLFTSCAHSRAGRVECFAPCAHYGVVKWHHGDLLNNFSLFFVLAFTFIGAIFSIESCLELIFDLQSMTTVRLEQDNTEKIQNL